jgi:hypothetical protein
VFAARFFARRCDMLCRKHTAEKRTYLPHPMAHFSETASFGFSFATVAARETSAGAPYLGPTADRVLRTFLSHIKGPSWRAFSQSRGPSRLRARFCFRLCRRYVSTKRSNVAVVRPADILRSPF